MSKHFKNSDNYQDKKESLRQSARIAVEKFVEMEINGYDVPEEKVKQLEDECEMWLMTWFDNYSSLEY